ncbi:prenyltransferase [Paenibacillus sp. N1-5-1-14]|uniref:prenyltransferase n=1 Tax=Paenibacillus radicibacter TaxID=2972488 RepID=UPI00215933FD|nr:prenyltransferase [Paenibacillus radicibacter]MCR8643087.1 prenyltransferase [Paenibacillus radicibacter]
MTKWDIFMKATRFQVAPVMVLPVVIGAVGAVTWEQTFSIGWFLLTLLGAVSLHLFSNMVNDLWDYRSGADKVQAVTQDTLRTHSGLLTGELVPEKQFARWTWGMLLLTVVCGALLAVMRGPMVWVYGILGALIAYFYVAPPLRLAYRGKGFSEVSILVSFGILPVLGSYYVQTGTYDMKALLVSLPIGLLTTLILFNHHFLHWQADEEAGKRTLVVVLGEERALAFSRFILILAILSLLTAVWMEAFPIYVLLALVFVYPIWAIYRKLGAQNPAHAYGPLMGASLKLTLRSGLVMIAALLIQRFIG